MIEYDWDENKRISNIEKHGVDFMGAYDVYESSLKVTLQGTSESESRYVDIAPVGNRLMVLVYIIRDEKVRIISYRKARRPKEEKIYYSLRPEEE